MDEQEPLEFETFDQAAMRPPLTMGLPHTLATSLLAAGVLFVLLYNTNHTWRDLAVDVAFVGLIGAIWSAAKIMLRSDYHGWDIFVAWLIRDARMLDTKDWGGPHLSSFPLRSIYRTGASDDQ